MAQSMSRHQMADRAYWRPIIARLRELRAAGQLALEGTTV